MSFLAPLAGILAALTLPVVIVLYFLKLRRREVTVPSTLLWQRSFMDLRANTPFQRLRRNLLMFLQLAILAALAFALAQPLIKAPSLTGRSVVLCMDVSASMATREASGIRLDLAKERAAEVLASLSRSDEAMVVAFHRTAETVQTFTSVRAEAADAVNRLRPRETGTAIADALILAVGALRARASPEVVVITDGVVGTLPAIPPDEQVPIRVVVVGATRANVGLTALEVRAPPEPGSGPEVFVRVQNTGPDPAEVKLECRLDGKLLASEPLALAGGAEQPFVVPLDPEAAGLCEVALAERDAFPVDDVVRTQIVPERKFRVTLVAEDSYILDKFLRSMKQLEAVKVTPADFAREGPMAGVAVAPDVVVLDVAAAQQAATLAPGSYLLFGGCKLAGIKTADDLEYPMVLDWNRAHPVTRFTAFSAVNIERARHWDLPEDADVIVEAERGPLIASLVRGGVRVLLVAFDPIESDWPLQKTFPLFMANAIEWLAGGASPIRGHHRRTGDPLLFEPAPDAKVVTLEDPAGAVHEIAVDATGTTAWADTFRMGLYTVRAGERQGRAIAMNLLDPAESKIAPVENLPLEGSGLSVAVTREAVEAQRPMWRWVVLAAFAVLMLEWYVYTRRAI